MSANCLIVSLKLAERKNTDQTGSGPGTAAIKSSPSLMKAVRRDEFREHLKSELTAAVVTVTRVARLFFPFFAALLVHLSCSPVLTSYKSDFVGTRYMV